MFLGQFAALGSNVSVPVQVPEQVSVSGRISGRHHCINAVTRAGTDNKHSAHIFLPSPAHIQISEKWSCPTSWNSSGLYSLHAGEKAERLRDDPPQLYPSSHPSWCLVLLLRFPSIKPGQQSRAARTLIGTKPFQMFPAQPYELLHQSSIGLSSWLIEWAAFTLCTQQPHLSAVRPGAVTLHHMAA